MTITPTEVKTYTFVKGSTTVVKTFTGASNYSVVVRRGDVLMSLSSSEFSDLKDSINDAYDKPYADPA